MAPSSAPAKPTTGSLLALTAPRTALLYIAALTGITLLGLAVRLYGLTSYGIWFDEAYHIQLVKLPTLEEMLGAVLSNPPSDPLYTLLLRAWTGLFGYEDGAIRMLSVLLSTATLPATYWLGTVLIGRAAGLIGALLLALSPYAVEFGQEAALYALASLLTTLAVAAGLRWRAAGKGRLTYLILGILAIYTSYVVAVILALFALLTLVQGRDEAKVAKRDWLTINFAIFAAWLPWLIALVLNWVMSAQPRATLTHYATPAEVFGALVQFSSGSATLLQRQWVWAGLALVASAGLLVASLLAARRTHNTNVQAIAIISAAIFLVPAVVSAASGLWLFIPHFMLFLLPSIFVLIGGGWSPGLATIEAEGKPRKWLEAGRRTSAGLLGLWLVAQVGGLALFYRYPPHGADGLREIAALLRSRGEEVRDVYVTPPALTPTLQQYYSGSLQGLPVSFDLRSIYLPYDPPAWNAQSLKTLESSIEPASKFWLVYRPELDEDGRFMQTLKSRYKLLERHQYEYAGLYLFQTP
ncbi:MAG TPA: glycosyltransferase family 39 protein [Chloroflexia bacterium]|nr:glycosyltransferase family 39 protein [Chloroflexia bacterium]